MSMISRRNFVERLGLGAGAVLLSPIASSLLSQARGEPQRRRRVVFMLVSNGFPPSAHAPAEFRTRLDAPVPGTKEYTWPRCVKPLEAMRDRMLLIDGLGNRGSGQHSGGYGALSCWEVARGSGEYDGPPGNVTIDQFIAGAISKETPLRSILWGVSKSTKNQEQKVFAAARERPVPHYVNARVLFGRLFSFAGGARTADVRRRFLMDSLRDDLVRLSAALAPEERRKLEHYTAAMEEFERRQGGSPALCPVPAAPGDTSGSGVAIEDRLEAMADVAALGFACGLSNVMGVSSGCGFGHASPAFTRIHVGTPFESEGRLDYHGHDPKHGSAMEYIYEFHSQLIARMAKTWASIKEGDTTILDQTVVVMMSDNAEAHHASHSRYPLVVIGDAGGALKADGRFIRYPSRQRSLADLFCSIATAVGAPTETFGKGGRERVQGPIAELMAAV